MSYVKEHKSKAGTPTMGGLAFVIAGVISAIIFEKNKNRAFVLSVVVGLAYMAVGILDDLSKKRKGKNEGLTVAQKLVFQTFVAIFAGIYCMRANLGLNVPIFGNVKIGFWALPLSVFVFLATVNCVNLTDGLDGLAAGASLPYFLFLGILSAQTKGLTVLCFSLCGALGAYLLFNSFPASVFMGDTGSLALGGFASALAILSGNTLYIPLLGAPFVLSGITVLMQVIYYKATKGKRIFLMTPVHHHFQMKGYSETKIAYAYAVVSTLFGLLTLVFLR